MTDPNPFRPEASADEAVAKTAGDGALGAHEKPSGEKAKSPGVPSARPQIDSMRETVESIAVAFILAFFFRTFVAEAFVIPTGSMATTLMGRHKDIECPNCKFRYETTASSEADKDGNVKPKFHVEKTICPNCGMPVDTSNEEKYPSYRGDRIIVSKVDSRGPRRWDVIVFRFPQEAGTNYIKRLVGLPGEELRILNGDLQVRPLDKRDAEFHILRKPPDVVLAMLRSVYDNDYVVDWMTEAGWPPRWQPCPMDMKSLLNAGWQRGNEAAWPWQPGQPSGAGQWTTADGYRSFSADGSGQGEVWLRYQHLSARDSSTEQPWRDQLWPRAPANVASAFASSSKQPPPAAPIKPKFFMINDFTGYNYGYLGLDSRENPQRENPWVGDLAIGCDISAADGAGEVVLELIKGGHRFHCRLNLADRGIRLSADDEALPFEAADGRAGAPVATAKQTLPDGKRFHVLFANVDSQLLVWVDGRLVDFDGPTGYHLNLTQKDETTADYSPVGIASRGAHVTVNHLRIMRDVYYLPGNEDEINGDTYRLAKNPDDPTADQFFVLGDNSPQSADARSWPQPYVERKLLIGKALFIFWPHSWDSPVPFTPNWKRMKFIR